MTNKLINTSTTIIQIVLLTLHYGNILRMPLWLVWLPILLDLSVVAFVIVVLILMFLFVLGVSVLAVVCEK